MDAEAAAIAREMKDRQEIYDCIMRYCRGIDRLDRETLLSAYHPDAIDDHGSTYVGGIEGFADAVQGILSDPRSWIASGKVAFKRVPYAGASLQIILASPAKVDQLCYPLPTGGTLSCRVGSKVVINAVRWRDAVPDFVGDLRAYQGYVINHEVGHGLGQGHRYCPGPGKLAPVMMQQSKGVGECRPNAWPRPYEIASLSGSGAPSLLTELIH